MKNKFQNVDFKNFHDFLDYIPKDELKIVQLLRSLIFQCIPDCREKLSYNVPFYRKHKNICFIWPSSIPWGKIIRNGVRLGFTNGYLFENKDNYLDKGDRKQIYCKDFIDIGEIDVDLLKSYFFEAALIDEKFNKKEMNCRI